jgi:lipid II:glycine glycyltransferase (peptidoglycan interpeptide bridge formation enzyme)
LGRERKWKYLELRNCTGLQEIRKEASPSVSFYSHTLGLSGNTDQLFARFESSVRRAIRRSEKSGVTVETSQSPEAIREFYRLHCQTRKTHGLPPQPLKFFLNIQKHVLSENMGMVVSAKHNNHTVASAVFFHFGSEAVYKFGASDSKFQDLRPNNLVMWEAVQRYAKMGIATLNFGRTSLTNEGLRRYKLGWGTQEKTMEYHKFDFRQDAFVRGQDQASGWHNNVFRALPLFAAKWCGAFLYKHTA